MIYRTTIWSHIVLPSPTKRFQQVIDGFEIQSSLQLDLIYSGHSVLLILTVSIFCRQEQVSVYIYDKAYSLIPHHFLIDYIPVRINANFFSETVTPITYAGSVSGVAAVNVPVTISQPAIFTGAHKVGFFDTLPYIRLEGVTVDFIYTVILLMMAAYAIGMLISLVNQTPFLMNRISGNIPLFSVNKIK